MHYHQTNTCPFNLQNFNFNFFYNSQIYKFTFYKKFQFTKRKRKDKLRNASFQVNPTVYLLFNSQLRRELQLLFLCRSLDERQRRRREEKRRRSQSSGNNNNNRTDKGIRTTSKRDGDVHHSSATLSSASLEHLRPMLLDHDCNTTNVEVLSDNDAYL